MLPLRDRATAIYGAAKRNAEAEQQRWQQVEKPTLKHFARGLKETLAVQHQALAAQQARVASLANQQGDPVKVHQGFNVIRARVTSDGRPLPTDELRVERDRLTTALNQLAIDIAAAKAEIQSQRRAEEIEIWETQLVALQDTMRVYRQEINMIEVELLGREQQERIEQDRQQAEASGLAQMQRLQEQATQTRVRFNRAKQQYHFPPPHGYNITFGGGGIYGACKDITISEVHGNVSITAQVDSGSSHSSSNSNGGSTAQPNCLPGSDGQPRARLVIQFGVANSAIGSLSTGSSRPSAQPSSGAQQRGQPVGSGANGSASDPRPKVRAGNIDQLAGGHSSRDVAVPRQPSNQPRPVAGSNSQPVAPPASFKAGSAAASGGSAGGAPGSSTATPATAGQQQPAGGSQPLPQRKPSKAKAVVRFLKKIGTKKDKYQGKEQPQLQPSDSDPGQRTLASKLLHRKSSHVDPASQLGGLDASQRALEASTGRSSVGDFPSHHYSDSLGDDEELPDEVEDVPQPGNSPQHLLATAASQQCLGISDMGVDDGERLMYPLTREALEHAAEAASDDDASSSSSSSEEGLSREPSPEVRLPAGYDRGSWLRGRPSSGVEGASTWGGESSMGASSDIGADLGEAVAANAVAGSGRQGVHVVGRVTGFGLVGERGSKVPNLSLAQGDVEGHVFVRFVFEYTKLGGWQPAEKPVFDVQRLSTRLKGNNVPMPDALIQTILRMAIPGLIQRKLLGVVPKELGSYLLEAGQGFHVDTDVTLVGTPLSVLDAELAFEVKGPAKTPAEAKKQQQKYAAAKEARRLLGLSLPQVQILTELFRGKGAMLELSQHPISIFQLIALQRAFDRQPQLYAQLCQVLNTAYQLLADKARIDAGDFNFKALMDGPVSRMRRKPSRVRVIMHNADMPLNLDAIMTAVRDYFQRALEEMLIKGPLANPRDNPEYHEDEASLDEQVEVLHAWHAWMLQELAHFKSKFQGAGGTVLGAASSRGFSAGVENCFYEGPLRLRVPVNMQLDSDGAFSFDVPLPSAEGAIGEFVDGLKSRLVPSHLRPPLGSINWIPPTGDSEVDSAMQAQMDTALRLVQQVLDTLKAKVMAQGPAKMDEDPVTAISQPRTLVGDRLGRFIVNRLRVHVRLDERRISEILQGIDSRTMGAGFVATAGRILGHLGDVMTLGFTPASPSVVPGKPTAATPTTSEQRQQQYLFVFESSDISRLRADVQSLGFQSLITPGGAVRLVHAVIRAFLSAFKRVPMAQLKALDERFQGWYQHMTRESLDISLCLDVKGGVQAKGCVVHLSGTADEAQLRETSPLMAVNDLELLPAAVAMFGGPPSSSSVK